MTKKKTGGKVTPSKKWPPPPRASKDIAGEVVIKLTAKTEELDIDLDRTIKKLKEIKRLLAIIDLKKKVGDLLSYLKLKGK